MLRDLFRQKLDGQEVVPSPGLKNELFRKLGRKEFLRFNPERFNIYYAGAIFAAGAAAALILLLSDSRKGSNFYIPSAFPVTKITEEAAQAEESDTMSSHKRNYLSHAHEEELTGVNAELNSSPVDGIFVPAKIPVNPLPVNLITSLQSDFLIQPFNSVRNSMSTDKQASELSRHVRMHNAGDNDDMHQVEALQQESHEILHLPDLSAGSGNYIKFPNVFFPNLNGPSGGYYSSFSDASATVFHPVSSGVSEYRLRIFSKSGILIFESDDINSGWDGYYKGQLCLQGVYIWNVNGRFINGEPFTMMGDLTLLKN